MDTCTYGKWNCEKHVKVHHSVKVELEHKAYLLNSEVSSSLGTAQVLSPVGRHRCVLMNPSKQSETLTV